MNLPGRVAWVALLVCLELRRPVRCKGLALARALEDGRNGTNWSATATNAHPATSTATATTTTTTTTHTHTQRHRNSHTHKGTGTTTHARTTWWRAVGGPILVEKHHSYPRHAASSAERANSVDWWVPMSSSSTATATRCYQYNGGQSLPDRHVAWRCPWTG